MSIEHTISQIVKEDLIEGKIHNICCKRAFISGLIRGAGNYYVTSSGFGINIQHHSSELIVKSAQLVKQLIFFEPVVKMRQQERKVVYEMDLPGAKCFDLLEETYISPAPYQLYEGICPELIESPCCQKAFLQGVFLASGTISIPSFTMGERGAMVSSKGGYYLEFNLSDEKVAEDLLEILTKLDAEPKMRRRGESFSVYLKDAEKISDLCALLGAMRAVLEIQNTIVMRSIRNDENRKNNCTSANIDKTIEASLKQQTAIEKLLKCGILSTLDKGLQDTAKARLEYPELSLAELTTKIEGNPSKSCLNHRMRKLLTLAEELE